MKSKRKNHRNRFPDLTIYFKRVNKNINPQNTVSKAAALVLNDFMADMMHQTMDIAVDLKRRSKRKTLMTTDVHHAVQLLLPRTLARFAEREAGKSLLLINLQQASMIPARQIRLDIVDGQRSWDNKRKSS